MIEAQRDQHRNLTIFRCSGKPTPEEVEHQLREFYSGSPTLHTIWDYTAADLSALTADRIEELAAFLKRAAHSRTGGRAALVFTLPQLGAINDRLPSMAELSIEEATIKIFDGLDKAEAWIFPDKQ